MDCIYSMCYKYIICTLIVFLFVCFFFKQIFKSLERWQPPQKSPVEVSRSQNSRGAGSSLYQIGRLSKESNCANNSLLSGQDNVWEVLWHSSCRSTRNQCLFIILALFFPHYCHSKAVSRSELRVMSARMYFNMSFKWCVNGHIHRSIASAAPWSICVLHLPVTHSSYHLKFSHSSLYKMLFGGINNARCQYAWISSPMHAISIDRLVVLNLKQFLNH